MARKNSIFVLVPVFIFMAFLSTGCRQSYAEPIDASLATPTIESNDAFPQELPSDMEGVFEAGAQTATAEALVELGESAPAPAVATATPAVQEDSELTPEEASTEETPTDAPATEGAVPTSTAPVLNPTETSVPEVTNTSVPSVDVNNLPSSYTLQKGEFPYCIARRFNVDPSELLSLNGLSSANAAALQPGLTLKIPQSGQPFPYNRMRNTHPVTYVVPVTTTVYDIACFFGDVDPANIISMNALSNPNSVPAGTSLQIP